MARNYAETFVDYYAALGLQPTASPAQITSRYQHLKGQASDGRDRVVSAVTRFCNSTGRSAPDKGNGIEDIQSAYWVLTRDRMAYDSVYRRMHHTAVRPSIGR